MSGIIIKEDLNMKRVFDNILPLRSFSVVSPNDWAEQKYLSNIEFLIAPFNYYFGNLVYKGKTKG